MRLSPRTTGLALTCVVAVGALSACASTVAPTADSPPGATGRFAQALRHVPVDSTRVDYTDWAAAGHPGASAAPAYFAGGWRSLARTLPPSLAFAATEADWELDLRLRTLETSIVLHFPRVADLDRFADRLVRANWQRSRAGALTVLERGAPVDADDPADPTRHEQFRLDPDAGTITHTQGWAGRPIVTSNSGFASSAAVRPLLAGVESPVSAHIRVGRWQCAVVAVAAHDEPLSPAALAQLNKSIGDVSRVQGVLIAITSRRADTGIARVALASARVASAELGPRSRIGKRIENMNEPTGVQVAAAGALGAVEHFTLRSAPGPRIATAVRRGGLGVDSCPVVDRA